MLADLANADLDLVVDQNLHVVGDAHPTGLCERFEPRRDIDAVAKQVSVVRHQDVPDCHADAEQDPLLLRQGSVDRTHLVLDIDGAADRIHRAIELGEDGIARGIEHTPVVVLDLAAEQPGRRRHAQDRAFLVLGDEAAVPGHVGSKNDGDFSLHVAGPWVELAITVGGIA
ncbi:MAG TPA: hypothetical protein VNK52_13700 [Hyphomicrobiaceae bacterium]|nr:hypothetical protein [Hyphomicrobiaceae bacterium]